MYPSGQEYDILFPAGARGTGHLLSASDAAMSASTHQKRANSARTNSPRRRSVWLALLLTVIGAGFAFPGASELPRGVHDFDRLSAYQRAEAPEMPEKVLRGSRSECRCELMLS
jgi:hypothetical protein